MRAALDRFYTDGNRPLTEPTAIGYMLEMLCADFIAGPNREHPASHLRRIRPVGDDGGSDQGGTT